MNILRYIKKAILTLFIFLFILSPIFPVLAEEGVETVPSTSSTTEDTPSQITDSIATDISSTVQDSSTEVKDSTTISDLPPSDQDSSDGISDEAAVVTTPETTESLLYGEGSIIPDNYRTDLSGKFSIPKADKISGALIYEYPLSVPPGRNGVEPDLKLAYNSQSNDPNGIFGYGWSINIPFIERINRQGTNNLYSQNYFNSSLSGELVSTSINSVYLSKIDNGEFLNYTYSNNSWLVKDKKGVQYKFGYSADTRQDNPNNSSQIFKWMIEEIRDTNDNYIKYEYYKDGGQIYPSKITYTGNGITDGIFSVEFSRESRTDLPRTYNTAFAVSNNYRINLITAKINNNWVKKYIIAYTVGENGLRSMLSSITEEGKDESDNTVSLPATSFEYRENNISNGWVSDTNWSSPVSFMEGVQVADVNGDGFQDLVQSYSHGYGPTWDKGTYLNNGDNTWVLSQDWVPPIAFLTDNGEQGIRMLDVNGDGLADILMRNNESNVAYINNGDSWTQNNNWNSPFVFATGMGSPCYDECKAFVMDLNGDGLPDLAKAIKSGLTVYTSAYLNNGNGWTSSNWTSPVDFREGVIPLDANNDGLTDLAQSYYIEPTTFKNVYLNNGNNTWIAESSMEPLILFGDSSGYDQGVRIADNNGDNLMDVMKRNDYDNDSNLNKDTGWSTDTLWRSPVRYADGYGGRSNDFYVQIFDVDGDGLSDNMLALRGANLNIVMDLHRNNGIKTDLLSKITYSSGGESDISYAPSTLYESNNLNLNPKLSNVIYTVSQIDTLDGLGTTTSLQYSYEGGEYYYAGPYDRRFAGFSKITETNSQGYVNKAYYHQGNDSNSSQGEYSDHQSKIGKPYREEVYDNSGNLYSKTINKWDRYDLGSGANFVKLVQKVDFAYDGNSSHKDKAETYTYDDSSGNLLTKTEWGEVAGSDDGTFTDTGSDKLITNTNYLSDYTNNIFALPYQEYTNNQTNNKIRENKYYYDNQALGGVLKGNLTKKESWKSGLDYVDVESTYNAYGLVTERKDPRDKTTAYTYDIYYLYPVTVINPLNQSTEYEYDYSSGKVKQVTDPNDLVFQTVYDGLDRITEEKQPDLSVPSNLVTKTTYAYTDFTIGNSIHKTDYLDSTTSIESYIYNDGLGRIIQKRKEAEVTNNYIVNDYVYNNIGLLYKETTPYTSGGSSRTSINCVDEYYFTTYAYDPMQRLISAITNLGTTTYTYDDWKVTITDPRSKPKDLYKDAYNNLVRVDEHNNTNTYTTYYDYDGNNNLIGITDALGNIREFTYDGLGRQLSAEDLHDPSDITFGFWSYTYDDSGNLISKTDPKNQIVNYSHDDINRKLSENYAGQAGTEVSYTYDACAYGIGRLCGIVNNSVDISKTYDALGNVSSETKTIDSINYQTSNTYDKQGNILTITNPDNSQIKYQYNSAGTLEKVQKRENTDINYIDVVSNFDYSPIGKPSTIIYTNGITTTNTYDPTKLYRLTSKQSSVPDFPEITTNTVTFYTTYAQGDGSVSFAGDTIWDNAHNASWGNEVDNSSSMMSVGTGIDFWTYRIDKGYIPFDTSSLPNNAVITDAKLKLYVQSKSNNDNDGEDWMTIVRSTQNNYTQLSLSDYEKAGSIHSPTEGIDANERKDISNISTGQYLVFNLNSTGRSWVSTTGITQLAIREGHDVLDHSFYNNSTSVYNKLDIRTKEYGGTTSIPALEVTYQVEVPTNHYFQNIAYTYDANGNITKIVDSSQSHNAKTVDYVYDDLNRLTSATSTLAAYGSNYTQTYTYDAIGNITNKSDLGDYSYEGDQETNYANPHAVTSIESASYTYDNNGNLEGSGDFDYTWDYNNRLTNASSTSASIDYSYDDRGQRIKSDDGTITVIYPTKMYNTDGTTPTKHIYVGSELIATINGTGESSTVYTVLGDHLEGSNVITDTDQNVVESLDYYPFGSLRLDEKSSSYNEQRKFIGQEYDDATGLNYLNARYYDGARGQFVSQDPTHLAIGDKSRLEQITGQFLQRILSDPQQLNSYSYARNNPIRFFDPEGEWVHVAAGAFIGGVIGLAGQGFQDLLGGNFSGYEAYVGSVAGGATFGAITAGTGGLSLLGYGAVGAGSGIIQSGVQQSLMMVGNKQDGYIGSQFLENAFTNTVGALIPSLHVAPVNVGKGSFAAVEKQIYTKLQNGTISVNGIQPSTYGKIITSNIVQQGPGATIQSVIGAISRQFSQISATISGLISSLKLSQEKKN